MLTELQIDRYSRQIILPEVGGSGQQRLLCASIALVDGREEAALTLLYLAAAGVGHVNLFSRSGSNAQRLAGEAKALNDDCKVDIVSLEAGGPAIDDAAVVLMADADASWARRTGLACARARKTLIWTRADGAVGYLAAFDPATGSGCHDCFAAERSAAVEAIGALDSSTGALLATLQATEAIKHILGVTSAVAGSTLRLDTSAGTVTTIPAVRRSGCPVCGVRAST